jgi:diacylglycerol kinase (CTP)
MTADHGELRSRNDLHLSRKVFHIISGTLITLLFVNTFTRVEGILLMTSGFLILSIWDLMRLGIPALNRLTFKLMGPLMREGEKNKPSAQLYYLLGLVWAVAVLPKPIAVQAILTLAWMDPVAALFGIRFGRVKWNTLLRVRTGKGLGDKTIEGSCAGFLAMPVDGTLWWPDPFLILILASVGGFSALVAEAWPTQWDDNVNIPFWSGLAVWTVAVLMGVPMRYL